MLRTLVSTISSRVQPIAKKTIKMPGMITSEGKASRPMAMEEKSRLSRLIVDDMVEIYGRVYVLDLFLLKNSFLWVFAIKKINKEAHLHVERCSRRNRTAGTGFR